MPRVKTWAEGNEHAKNSEMKWPEGYGKKTRVYDALSSIKKLFLR